jgi:cytochrome c oxidase subunit 2
MHALYQAGGYAKPWQIGFQSAASPLMEGITWMHNFLLIIIGVIGVAVTALIIYTVWRFRASKNPTPSKITHNVTLEIVWTLIPTIIVLAIMVPSIKLIMFSEKAPKEDMTISIRAHTWYWAYEFPKENISFESRMLQDDQLDKSKGHIRLLSVDNPVVVPTNKVVKLLITSGDVLHSFAVPSLGIKRDAIPGRVNETWFKISKPGKYYGQCSELCGVLHGFMPIEIHAVSEKDYTHWIEKKKGDAHG